MSRARDRADRGGTSPVKIGTTQLNTDSGDLKVTDTSNNLKKVVADEIHIGDSSNKVIIKKGSDHKVAFQTQASGSSAADSTAGGVQVFANVTAMSAAAGNNGDLGYVTATKKLYVNNGGGWYAFTPAVNTSPVISSPSSGANIVLGTDGTATTIEITATDADEGTVLQYSYAVTTGSLTNGGGASATITTSATSGGTYSALAASTNTTNRFFKVTPTTNSSHGGTFTLTFSASDTINAATTVQNFSLTFATYGGMFHKTSNRGLTISASNDLDINDGAFTMEFWYWGDPNGNTYSVCQTGPGDGNTIAKGFDIYHAGQYMGIFWRSGSSNLAERYTTGVYDRTWNHCAVVRDSSGNATLYVNGAACGTAVDITSIGSTATLDWYLGWNGQNANAGNRGYMSNFRFVKGTAVYTSNFVPSFNLDAVANTTMLTLNNTTLADASSESNTSLLSFGTNASIVPYGYPHSGAAYHDQVGGGYTYTAENLGTDSWTVEFWINCQSAYYDRALYQHGGDAGSWGIYLKGNTSSASASKGNIVVYEKASSGNPTQTILATSTNRVWHADDSGTTLYDPPPAHHAGLPEVWNHVAVTFTDSTNTGQIWIDGKPDATFTKSSAWTFTETTGRIIGDNVTGSGSGYNSTGRIYAGMMQDFRLVKGSVVYATPAGHNSGNSTYFDGTGDYAQVPNNARFSMGTGDFTVEGWVYPYDTTHNEGYFIVGGSAGGGWNSSNYGSSLSLLRGYGDGGNLGFYGNGSERNLDTAVNPAINTWFHFAFVRISGTLKIYIDGVQKHSVSDTTNYSGTSLILGSVYDVNQAAHFNMSNFRVVKGTGVYTSAFSVPTAPLTDVSGTSILCCQTSSGTTADNSSHSQTFTHHGNTTTSTKGPWDYTATTPTDKLTAISGTSILTCRTVAGAKPGSATTLIDESSHNRTITRHGSRYYAVANRPWQ